MNSQNRNRLTDSKNKLMVAVGGGWGGRMGKRDSQGIWDGHVHTTIFKTDNQQGPTEYHMELCHSVKWQPGWEGDFEGEWI